MDKVKVTGDVVAFLIFIRRSFGLMKHHTLGLCLCVMRQPCPQIPRVQFQFMPIRVQEVERRAFGGVFFPLGGGFGDVVGGVIEGGFCAREGHVGVIAARADVLFKGEAKPEIAKFEIRAFGPFCFERGPKGVAVKGDGFGQVGTGQCDVVHAC